MYHGSTTKLNLTTGQKNSLKSLMKNTTDKKTLSQITGSTSEE